MSEKWHAAGPFTVFDIETTGMSPSRDRIVEIAAVRVDLDGAFSRFSTLVNPGIPIPPGAINIHGITNEMVASAPNFTNAAYGFLDFIRDSKIVAHNARFDLGFMQESLARTGLPLIPGGVYDSIVLIRKAFPGLPSYSLASLCNTLELVSENGGQAHRSAYDAEMTMMAFSMAMRKLCENATV